MVPTLSARVGTALIGMEGLRLGRPIDRLVEELVAVGSELP